MVPLPGHSPTEARKAPRRSPTAGPLMNNGHIAQLSPPTRTLKGVQILGTGHYAPENVVTNEDLSVSHGFDPDWIVNRTGILERRFAPPHQATSDLCYIAGARCLKEAGVKPSEVDLLVLATMTPDMYFPSTACIVQDRLHLSCPAFDQAAACAGFAYALITASQFVATGTSRRALVIGGDCNSPVINANDQESLAVLRDVAAPGPLGA